MNKVRHVLGMILLSVVWLLGSCASVAPQQPVVTSRPPFQDGVEADMILRFFTWESIYMTKPDPREGGFLPLYTRDDIGREVKRRNINRNTAVVVISLLYREPEHIAQLSHEWTTYLKDQGFRRVVLLHAGPGPDINGLPVLNDSTISGLRVTGTNEKQIGPDSMSSSVTAIAGVDVTATATR